MTLSFKLGRMRRSLPPATSALALALGLAAGNAQAIFVTTYNTGSATPAQLSVTLPPGAVDPNYIRVLSPGGIGGGTPLGSADVVAPFVGWLAPNFTSAWIKPQFNFNGTVPPVFATSYYQTSFDLSAFITSTAAFIVKWATDDPNGRVWLNGKDLVTIGGNYGSSVANAWTNFSFSHSSLAASSFNPGMNYLTFQVDHLPNPVNSTGLRVEFSGDALPVPEPASYALFGLGLAAITLLRRRVTA